MKILLTGKNGQLGFRIGTHLLGEHETDLPTARQFDIDLGQ